MITTTVAAVDISLTASGCARITNRGQEYSVESWCRTSTGTRRDDLVDRFHRIWGIATDLTVWCENADLVVVEGPSFGSKGGSAHDRSGLWWRTCGRILALDIPIVVIPPTTRAKFATNDGRADKAAVTFAMSKLWPEWEPMSLRHMNDEGDALSLATAGIQLLGLSREVPPKWRVDALSKVEVPEKVQEMAA